MADTPDSTSITSDPVSQSAQSPSTPNPSSSPSVSTTPNSNPVQNTGQQGSAPDTGPGPSSAFPAGQTTQNLGVEADPNGSLRPGGTNPEADPKNFQQTGDDLRANVPQNFSVAAASGGGQDPTTAGANQRGTMPLVPSAPLTSGAGQSNGPEPHPFVQRLLATAKALGGDVKSGAGKFIDAATGGPAYKTIINDDGTTSRVQVDKGKGNMALAFALELMSGAIAGSTAHGPNAISQAAGLGLKKGEEIGEQNKQAQERVDQKAQQDYIRKFEAMKTNMQMFNAMQASGKHDFEVANQGPQYFKEAMKYWNEQDPGKIGNPDVSEDEAMKADHTEYMPVPTQTLPSIDPATGQQIWQDIHGKTVPPNTPFSHPQFIHRYALVHRDADVDLMGEENSKLMDATDDQIKLGLLPKQMQQAGANAKIPAPLFVGNAAQATEVKAIGQMFNGPNGILNQVNSYRDMLKGGGESPNAVNPEKDTIWDLFGGNTSKLSDFIEQHEGKTNPDGTPAPAARNNNPGNLVADASWTGPVDNKGAKPGQLGFRVYNSYEEGKAALDHQLNKWQSENPHESVADFFKRYTTPGPQGQDQSNYIKAAMQSQGASYNDPKASPDAQQGLQPQDPFSFIQQNPGSMRAFQEFDRAFYSPKNTTGSVSTALNMMRDSRQKATMVKFMGGDMQAASDYDTARKDNNAMQMFKNKEQAKIDSSINKREAEKKEILENNKNTIDAIVNGSAIDIRSVLTMRGFERGIVVDELLKRTNGQYSAAGINAMIKLNDEIGQKDTKGSFGNTLANIQTAMGHASAANKDLEVLKTLAPSVFNDTSIFNQPVKNLLSKFEGVNPEAAHAFKQYQIDLHAAGGEWQNLIKGGFAPQQEEIQHANDALNDTASLGNAQAALKGIMRNGAVRMEPLNQRYRTTMQVGGKSMDFPNLITPQTVQDIASMNDPELMQRVAHYQSGGTITGGPRGLGNEGKEVGLMLTPAAKQQGSKPNQQVVQRYADVYGKNPAEIKRALQANGWALQ